MLETKLEGRLTRRTRAQLLAFVVLTLAGTSYVGARYAHLGALVWNTRYTVTAEFAESGGIFTGAEVSYRGVKVGTVSDMRLTHDGVDVTLSIDNSSRPIPADTVAQVANKSAVGEQYVDLQPRTDTGPYLENGSVIAQRDTAVPVSPAEMLTSVDQLVTSIPQDSLRTTVSELGNAFTGTGDDLAGMIDTSNEFIKTAAHNFDVTTALIKDSNNVLSTQAAKGSAIRSFAHDLSLFTGTLADNDKVLRRVIDDGSATVDQLQTFLEQNGVDLGELINNLVTTGEVVVKRLPGIRQVLVLYPYAVAGAYTVVSTGPGGYEARMGLILNSVAPSCHDGYDPREQRSPTDGSNRAMDEDAHCAEPPTKSDPRGSHNAPRPAPGNGAVPVASYDVATRALSWGDRGADAAPGGWHGSSGLEALLLGPLFFSGP